MSVHLSASFYKATIDKFSKVADDPLAFPILLSFLEKAAQSSALMHSAKNVVANDQKFNNFYQKTRDNLPPEMAQIIQKHEEKIREKLRPAIQAEMHDKMRMHDLETELKVRKKYEERTDKKEQERQKYERAVVGKMIQLELESHQKIDALTKQHDDFVKEAKKQAKSDKKHKYIGYAVGVVGVAASVVGWPNLWQKITGQSSNPPPPLHVKLSSSGLCSPSDIRVEVNKDGTATLPSSGTVCLAVPDNVASDNEKAVSAPFVLPYGYPCASFAGRSFLDVLNDGDAVCLFKEDGSSIRLHMPKITPDTRVKETNTSADKEQGKPLSANRPAKVPSGKQHNRKRCP